MRKELPKTTPKTHYVEESVGGFRIKEEKAQKNGIENRWCFGLKNLLRIEETIEFLCYDNWVLCRANVLSPKMTVI